MPQINFKPGVVRTPHSMPRLFAEDYYKTSFNIRTHHVDYSDFDVPMYANDRVGDCTCAGIGHEIGCWTKYGEGTEALFSDSQVLDVYSAISGYDGSSQSDVGASLGDVLKYVKANGFGGYQIDAYAQLRNLTVAGLTTALYLYGSVYVAVALPQSAEDQFNAGMPWTVSGEGQIAGYHCITLQGFVPGADSAKWATWGAIQRSNIAWINKYVVEAWAIYSKDFIRAVGTAPNGLNESALLADMKSIVGD